MLGFWMFHYLGLQWIAFQGDFIKEQLRKKQEEEERLRQEQEAEERRLAEIERLREEKVLECTFCLFDQNETAWFSASKRERTQRTRKAKEER